ncbi:hypothetical protein [Candidatus Avelusimicrobium sp.]
MERVWHILAGAALIYVTYVMLLKKWDYNSEAKRQEHKDKLKQEGLSTCYFFIPPYRLLLFNILSGGFFYFYWSYKQWKAIISGYKNTARKPLIGGAWIRAFLGMFYFYPLAAIINRTCDYMGKKQMLSPVFWTILFWGGLTAACLPMLNVFWRLVGAACFFIAPFVLQKHILLLPKDLPPIRWRVVEMMFVVLGWIGWVGIFMLVKHFWGIGPMFK